MTATTDVVVIGGGIAGLSAAWEIAAECSVVLLEKEPHLASHATGRSAAVISETYGPEAVCALASASKPFLADPPDGFTTAALLRPRGMLWVSDLADSLTAVAGTARRLGAAHEALTSKQACELLPALRPGWARDALLEPDAMAIDVSALVEGYRNGLLARGGTIRTIQRVTAARNHGCGWRIDHTGGATVCDVVINAAGAWADTVARAAGLAPLGLRPHRRTAFVFPQRGVDATDWPLVMDFGGRFYFEPEGRGILASPAEESPCSPHDARPDEMAMARAVDDLAEATTLQVRGVYSRWAGLRTFAADRLPVVGFDPRARGLFWLAGQGGAGIKTAPALAALTRALVVEDDPAVVPGCAPSDCTPDDLAPDRLLG